MELADYMTRSNQMLGALKQESHRGQACVGDALLDELVKELFVKKLIPDSKAVNEILSDGQALGNHGLRLKLAYLNGWFGPNTYADCRGIHRIRNKMAHKLDIDSFDHPAVRDIVDGLPGLGDAVAEIRGEVKRVNFDQREDCFLWVAAMTGLRLWRLAQDADQPAIGVDLPIIRLHKPSQCD